jgi:class 3 adenylate cyclase
VAKLGAAERAKLPDSAFAYIDENGERRLPIHDEAHVRNALSRFSQVKFETPQARDKALKRLLNAAKKYRIVPVGFISNQLRAESTEMVLPSGFLTLLMTDIEGSTSLVAEMGDGYGALLDEVRTVLRKAVVEGGGHVVEARADELFAVFEGPRGALLAAITMQRMLREAPLAAGRAVKVRAGVHSGYPTLMKANYIGVPVHVTARICSAAHGGQIVVSADTRLALTGMASDGVSLRQLGPHRLRGIPDEVALFQVVAKGLPGRFPPLRLG